MINLSSKTLFAFLLSAVLFFGGLHIVNGAAVEFNADTPLDVSGLPAGSLQVGSSSKAGDFEISSNTISVDNVAAGDTFQIKTSAHSDGLTITPSGGSIDFSFSTSNLSSGNISQWTVSASSSVSVSTTIGVANTNTDYKIDVEGIEFESFKSNGSGKVTFTYSNFSTKTFNINQGDFASGEPSEPSPVQKPVKVKINNGNEVTTSTDVTVNLITGGNTERLRISNSKDLEVKKTKTIPFDGNGIETFKDKTEWNICYPENSCEEGVYKVFVKYESFGGLSSKVVSDSIEYQKPAMDKKEETKKEDSTETQKQKEEDKKQNEDTRTPQKNKEDKQKSKNKSSNVPNFSRNLELGNEGPAVKKLQVYLNNHGYKLAKKGPGSPGNETNYFGPKTRRALKEFQADHSSKILAPVGLENATGYFGPSTRSFINSNSSVEFSKDRSSSFSYTFKSEHDIGDTGPEVKALQKALDLENCFDYKSYTGYFGPITKKGVKCFQEKYEKDVLNPWNLDKGTGFFGSTTIEKMNELY